MAKHDASLHAQRQLLATSDARPANRISPKLSSDRAILKRSGRRPDSRTHRRDSVRRQARPTHRSAQADRRCDPYCLRERRVRTRSADCPHMRRPREAKKVVANILGAPAGRAAIRIVKRVKIDMYIRLPRPLDHEAHITSAHNSTTDILYFTGLSDDVRLVQSGLCKDNLLITAVCCRAPSLRDGVFGDQVIRVRRLTCGASVHFRNPTS